MSELIRPVLCPGTGCPQRDNCRRYFEDIDPLSQSVLTRPPWDGKTCLHYWPPDVPYEPGRRVTRWK